MTTSAPHSATRTAVESDAATTGTRPRWARTAGLLIVVGGVLLTAATAVELTADVATESGPATAFWVFFLASTLAHVAAMVPLALGRGDGEGAVGSSLVGKVALLGFGALFLANQSMYLVTAYLLPSAVFTDGAMAFLGAMSAVQGVALLVGGIVIVRAGVLTGAARWAVLVLALVGFALGAVLTVGTIEALSNAMYFVSTGAQIVAGLVILRSTVAAAK
ncbi:hypothetical protein IFU40_00470 [Microbacterium sp. CFBP 13617]|uniref:hypothetical protein n=1 Tax=Microbacterium sp. CFBP 13617 TaxID=2774035 RepID=UPI0017809D4C|nr:hypothetical protein [Microbacterium sp. CFBP 13617]MBD8217098.1 hypothetical protein [Microbacterium sp. CFBP 13617]